MTSLSIKRLLPDPFVIAIVTTVAFASFVPCHGQGAKIVNIITHIAISLLFFLHGAKLERAAIVAGMTHWRLHLLVIWATFAMFPLLGFILRPVMEPLVTPQLYPGVLFLCALPSTVQSSVIFTSMGRGNVAAAICSASMSSVIGILITPVITSFMIQTSSDGAAAVSPLNNILEISKQILLPFVMGQLLRPYIGAWVDRRRTFVKYVDQGSILTVVYSAFSAAVVEGLWHQVPIRGLLGLGIACVVFLACALTLTTFLSRRFGFNKADEITIVFCGSKKGLASGVAIAKVLFPIHLVGPMLLPLMIFHQIQLMTCAVLAQRYAQRQPKPVFA